LLLRSVVLGSDVVSLERPDLEEQRNELIVNINTDKTQLSQHAHAHSPIYQSNSSRA